MSTSPARSFGMPRRLAATFVATALTAGPALLLGAVPAHATGDHGPARGTAGAVVLRTGLNVGLLHKTLDVPLNAVLNEVHAPASASKTALTVRLDGIDHGKPFSVLRADAATARATADRHKTEGYANLVKAKVRVPGLVLRSLVEVRQVTAKAVCEAGERPRAEANVLGDVLVLGKRVGLTAGGTTNVKVPGVGEVRLDLSRKNVLSKSAAATALDLNVSLNPLTLGVAEVRGQVTLARATCTTPGVKAPEHNGSGGTDGGQTGGTKPDGGTKPAGGKGTEVQQAGSKPSTQNLAETGGSSATPYLAGGAALLVAAGAGAVGYARRRRNAAQGGRG
ncbi:LPXTG-motif cell wall anchor domain-containing protein [Streptomyces sp. KS_16]|nr:LPXTG-motif cell wall-anchored protein [Streptomyces sp. 2321.6]SDR53492.1 LPXTG-motif cell wall anchor domain-containing protein [Streptomyces sp. KS_16]SEC27327.1 LPXTG-motif cell wall anchor domain-containing protein [Streptomyces sp. 2133.1]SNC66279.1 LPXTG-motif cell wall anchor domain-containing protein [Streptomyces sp. 2114.4]